MKKLEDADKWRCLNCDASPLREQRAHFWAITRFHKVLSRHGFLTIFTIFYISGEVECQDGKASSSKSKQSCHTQERQQGEWIKKNLYVPFTSKGWRSRSSEQWVASSEWKKPKCCYSCSGQRLQCCNWGENVPSCSENVHHSQYCGVLAGNLFQIKQKPPV